MTTRVAGDSDVDDDLKLIVDALIDPQKQMANMSTDAPITLGEALATALRHSGILHRFELDTLRAACWKIDAHRLVRRVDGSSDSDSDVPF